jgi:hypothetical protein
VCGRVTRRSRENQSKLLMFLNAQKTQAVTLRPSRGVSMSRGTADAMELVDSWFCPRKVRNVER